MVFRGGWVINLLEKKFDRCSKTPAADVSVRLHGPIRVHGMDAGGYLAQVNDSP
jgi:hypothetical protein